MRNWKCLIGAHEWDTGIDGHLVLSNKYRFFLCLRRGCKAVFVVRK